MPSKPAKPDVLAALSEGGIVDRISEYLPLAAAYGLASLVVDRLPDVLRHVPDGISSYLASHMPHYLLQIAPHVIGAAPPAAMAATAGAMDMPKEGKAKYIAKELLKFASLAVPAYLLGMPFFAPALAYTGLKILEKAKPEAYKKAARMLYLAGAAYSLASVPNGLLLAPLIGELVYQAFFSRQDRADSKESDDTGLKKMLNGLRRAISPAFMSIGSAYALSSLSPLGRLAAPLAASIYVYLRKGGDAPTEDKR